MFCTKLFLQRQKRLLCKYFIVYEMQLQIEEGLLYVFVSAYFRKGVSSIGSNISLEASVRIYLLAPSLDGVMF